MTVFFSKVIFWKNGFSSPSSGFIFLEYVHQESRINMEPLGWSQDSLSIHFESFGKASWNSRILRCSISGCKTFPLVSNLFQRPTLTSHICLELSANILLFSLCAWLVIFLTWDKIAVIIGNSGISRRWSMKRDADAAELGRTIELRWSDEKYSQFQSVPWMVWEGD